MKRVAINSDSDNNGESPYPFKALKHERTGLEEHPNNVTRHNGLGQDTWKSMFYWALTASLWSSAAGGPTFTSHTTSCIFGIQAVCKNRASYSFVYPDFYQSQAHVSFLSALSQSPAEVKAAKDKTGCLVSGQRHTPHLAHMDSFLTLTLLSVLWMMVQ